LLTTATSERLVGVFVDIFVDPETNLLVPDTTITQIEQDRLVQASLPVVAASLLAGVLATIGTLGFSAAVADDYHARTPRIGPVLRRTLVRVPSVIAFMLLTSLVIVGIGLAGILGISAATSVLPGSASGGPGVFLALIAIVAAVAAMGYLTLRWLPAYPAMVEEGLGWRDALRRSWLLSGDNILRLLAIFLLATFMSAILSSVLGTLLDIVLTGVIGSALGLAEVVTSTVALSAASVLVAPLAPVLVAVQYFDLRARRDPLPVQG
jgi:hypothetical protein